MTTMSDKGTELLQDLPEYEQDDPTIRAMINALGNELQRIDDYLLGLNESLQVAHATGDLLSYWEKFLDLPVDPRDATDVSIGDAARINICSAAIRRRTAGDGSGWVALLDAVTAGQPWRHWENSDSAGIHADYQLKLSAELDTTDYRVGRFTDMVKQTTPAHLEISVIEIAGDDTFRVGISALGDSI